MINYDEYRKKNLPKYWKKFAKLWIKSKGRTARQRPRDPLEEKKLIEYDKRRMEQMIKNGELLILGPREARLKVY